MREYSKYVKGHISGSIHIDNNIFAEQNEDGINVIPNCDKIAAYLSKKGMKNNDLLVLVDDVFNLNCSLAAWTLHYFGFKNVILIDGAFSKWETESGELSTEEKNLLREIFQATVKNEKDRSEIEENLTATFLNFQDTFNKKKSKEINQKIRLAEKKNDREIIIKLMTQKNEFIKQKLKRLQEE